MWNPIVGGALSSGLESTFEDVVEGKPRDPYKVIEDTLIGAATAGISSRVERAIFPQKVRGGIAKTTINFLKGKWFRRELLKQGIDAVNSSVSNAAKTVYRLRKKLKQNSNSGPSRYPQQDKRVPDTDISPREPGYKNQLQIMDKMQSRFECILAAQDLDRRRSICTRHTCIGLHKQMLRPYGRRTCCPQHGEIQCPQRRPQCHQRPQHLPLVRTQRLYRRRTAAQRASPPRASSYAAHQVCVRRWCEPCGRASR